MVMKDVFDRSRYGRGHDVSELVQKILSERQRDREPSPTRTVERVIYANPDRSTILDDATQPLRPRLPEIPEGGDEKDFVERTLAPSGRRWTSSPPADSQRVIIIRDNDDYLEDGGLQYEDIGAAAEARVCGTSMENWRDSTCRSPSNVPETLNGDAMESGRLEARLTGMMPPATGRRETTRQYDVSTTSETSSVTTRSRKDAFGRYIPDDAVEIKVEMQQQPGRGGNIIRGDDVTSSASRQRRFVGETDRELEARSGSAAENHDNNVKVTSSGDGWTRVQAAATTRSTEDDGRIWIPVIHVSSGGSSPAPSKTEATKSKPETYRSVHVVEAQSRKDVSPPSVGDGRRSGDGRVAGAGSSQSFVVDVADRRTQARSGGSSSAELRDSPRTRKTEAVAGVSDQSAATASSSLRTGSGVGSYGFRSSIVVDPARPLPVSNETPTNRSTATVMLHQSAGDGGWVVEKAL